MCKFLFLSWNYSQSTSPTVLYEEKDILLFPALRTWKKKVCWIKSGEEKNKDWFFWKEKLGVQICLEMDFKL